jgi:trk system potassium uptake protein TrkH
MFYKNREKAKRRLLQRVHPAYLIILSYLSAALIGMILLSLPQASVSGRLPFVDALFTATSAICVTGLIVVDTGAQFTIFGKSIILVLIQLGGLGVMTFSVFLFLFLGRRLGIKGRWAINEAFSAAPIREVGELIKSIILFTFIAEAVGAILLYIHWNGEMGVGAALFAGLFHSVSAFCNAGFSLFTTSFMAYNTSWLMNTVIMLLIVVGGLGFPVIYEFITRFKCRKSGKRFIFSLHTRMVLTTTAFLIFSGALLIYLLERNSGIAALSFSEKILASFFQSVTARTAGFNTLDIPSLGAATLFIILMLMFIGASPGSCGGGIKTTSLAVFFAIMKSKIKGMSSVSYWKRTLPEETVSRVLAIFILAVLTVAAGLLILLVTQGGPNESIREYFLTYMFEAVSAFATVGLSMGVTSSLTISGKFVIIILMLLGRVGLLTIAYVVTRRKKKISYKYAEERVMIG